MANRKQRRAQAKKQSSMDKLKRQITNEVIGKAKILTAEQQTTRITATMLLVLKRHYGFSKRKSLNLLKFMNDIVDEVNEDKFTWDEIIQQSEEECGIQLLANPDSMKEFYNK